MGVKMAPLVITHQTQGDGRWVCWKKARQRSFAALRISFGLIGNHQGPYQNDDKKLFLT